MRRKHLAALAAPGLLLVFAGCQHIPPEPLDLDGVYQDLASRPLDVTPVQDYAAALAAQAGDDAQPFNLEDGLSLREAQAVALWYNMDLRIVRLEADQALAVARAAGRLPDPELGFETGEKREDGEAGSFLHDAGDSVRTWINSASLSITIPLSGRYRADKQLRAREAETAALRALEAEWQMLADLRAAWTRWSVAVERVALLEEHLALLDQFATTAESLADAGELSPISARLFSIERLRREAERDRIRATVAELKAGVMQHLGLLPDAPVELLSEMVLDAAEAITPDAVLMHPEMRRLRAAYETAEQQLRLELRRQYPDITLSPAYENEDSESSITLGMGIPIPVWNANREGIAEAAAARDIARARAEAAYHRLLSEAAQTTAALAGLRAQRTRIAEQIAPTIDTQLNESRALLDVGELDIDVLYQSLGQALEAKQELLNITEAEALAAARLAAIAASGETDFLVRQEDKQ